MSPLAVELLNRHKQSPASQFYGAEKRALDVIRRYGLSALDKAYKELTELGVVEPCGAPIQIPAGRSFVHRERFQLTQKGRDAVQLA
jgi:hypothetical protein